jgi:hypothetical protein
MPAVAEVRVFMAADPSPMPIDDEAADYWARRGRVELTPSGQPAVVVHALTVDSRCVFRIRSVKAEWAARAAYFIAGETGSGVAFEKAAAPQAREVLLLTMGPDFSLVAAYERVRRWHQRLPPHFVERMPRLEDHVPGRLYEVPQREGYPRTIGRTTHPGVDLRPWIGKGLERAESFGVDPAVPDGYFACVLAVYTLQEWALALWRQGARRFWFAACIVHSAAQGHEARDARSQRGLDRALRRWARGDRWVAVNAELDELMAPEGGSPH